MPPEQDSDALIAALVMHEVRFVLIGGLAAILQGSPFPTEDLDITPERDEENLERLSCALTALDARVCTQTEPDGLPFSHSSSSLAAAGVWNLVTRYGRLDISFVPNGTAGFPDLDATALDMNIEGVSIRVASLADIIRSKQAANRPKDQRVLPTLREILAHRHEKNRPA
ncbi:MAG: hypothetical protein QM602_02205 [Microbacterium sp.]